MDCLGSEIRRGSRRPVGRVSTEDWIKLSKEEKAAWDEKLKAERDLVKEYGFDSKVTKKRDSSDTAFVDTLPKEAKQDLSTPVPPNRALDPPSETTVSDGNATSYLQLISINSIYAFS